MPIHEIFSTWQKYDSQLNFDGLFIAGLCRTSFFKDISVKII
jgi:hypothetical protein